MCSNPVQDGKPHCDVYRWTRLEGDPGDLPNTKIYKFTMNESYAGNYTCTCRNQFGTSGVSNTVYIHIPTWIATAVM